VDVPGWGRAPRRGFVKIRRAIDSARLASLRFLRSCPDGLELHRPRKRFAPTTRTARDRLERP
jgi:hypothetical protein